MSQQRSQEDELANYIIEQREMGPREVDITPEVHYNDYGNRGVVDLVVEDKIQGEKNQIRIIELKSQSAVENVTGANEIIRQFQRHIDGFFKGSDYSKHTFSDITFDLAFYATDAVFDHIQENKAMYQSSMIEGEFGELTSMVTLRHPEAQDLGFPLMELQPDSNVDETRWNGEWFFTDILSDAKAFPGGNGD